MPQNSNNIKSFREFDLSPSLQEGIDAMGFDQPTPIQIQAIPEILSGKDLIGCAQTGTGKTGAFLIPLLHKIKTEPKVEGINSLIIVPTRELALQIDQQLQGFSYQCPEA